jgi:hypothetical protein
MATTVTINYRGAVPPGDLKEYLGDLYGPSDYTQLSVAVPLTGGQALEPSLFGLKSIIGLDVLANGTDGTGIYTLDVYLVPQTAQGRDAASLIARWVVASTGAQVEARTDLSAIAVRVRVIGY